MKLLCLRLVILILSAIPTFAMAAECDTTLQMTSDQIGPIKLGMTEEELISVSSEYSLKKKEYWSEMDGADYIQFILTICEDNTITAEFYATAKVYTLSTSSLLTITKEGANVGMTAGQLQTIYPNAQLINAWNEGLHRFFFVDDGLHGVFEFGPGRCELGMSNGVSSDCNKVLPNEVSISYWTNSAYTKPGVWKQ